MAAHVTALFDVARPTKQRAAFSSVVVDRGTDVEEFLLSLAVARDSGVKRVDEPARRAMAAVGDPVPHKDFSDLYEEMSGEGASASEAHRCSTWGHSSIPLASRQESQQRKSVSAGVSSSLP
jgi:hypothetical protein